MYEASSCTCIDAIDVSLHIHVCMNILKSLLIYEGKTNAQVIHCDSITAIV